jgi:hypothetical protein
VRVEVKDLYRETTEKTNFLLAQQMDDFSKKKHFISLVKWQNKSFNTHQKILKSASND